MGPQSLLSLLVSHGRLRSLAGIVPLLGLVGTSIISISIDCCHFQSLPELGPKGRRLLIATRKVFHLETRVGQKDEYIGNLAEKEMKQMPFFFAGFRYCL